MRQGRAALTVTCVVFLYFCASSSAQAAAIDPVADAQAQFRLELMIEASGVFWIAAELAILFCMTAAVRIFATRPLPSGIALSKAERRRAICWAAGIAALVVAVFGRHFFVAPLPDAYGAIAAAGKDVRALVEQAYTLRAHIHVAIWCAFITAWVLLEIAIVVQGLRAYKGIKRLIADG